MSNPVISARDVCKAYTMGPVKVRAVDGVSLDIEPGETVCIMGASGAGKSTLLNMLGGLDRPTAGRVDFDGRNLYRLSPKARNEIRATRVGFVFQSYHLLLELDVLENVILPAQSRFGYFRRAAACRERAAALLEEVGLKERMRHRPLELSGGEQQRVALARALMNEPDVLLADEPTGNLDTATGAQVLEMLFQLTRDRGHTLVMVTHNQDVADQCSRTLVMQDGRLA